MEKLVLKPCDSSYGDGRGDGYGDGYGSGYGDSSGIGCGRWNYCNKTQKLYGVR